MADIKGCALKGVNYREGRNVVGSQPRRKRIWTQKRKVSFHEKYR